MLRLLHSIRPAVEVACPSYIVADDDPIHHRGITEVEHELLFGDASKTDENHAQGEEKREDVLSFMHNDLQPSNIIAIVDWEMMGYFGWKRAGAVHGKCRVPRRERCAHLDLAEERLVDLTYWNDLYAVAPFDK